MNCLLNKTQPSLDRWQYIRRSKEPLRNFWPYSLLLILVLALSAISIRELTFALQTQTLLTWKGVLYTYLVISVIGGWTLTGIGLGSGGQEENFDIENLCIALLSFLYPVALSVQLYDRIRGTAGAETFREHVQVILSAGFSTALTYIPTLYLLRYFSAKVVIVIWVSIAVFVLVVVWAIRRHLSRYDNPLRKFAMELQEQTI